MDGLQEFLLGILQIPPMPEDQIAEITYHLDLEDGEYDIPIRLQQNEVKQILRILFFAAERTQRDDLPFEYDRDQAFVDRLKVVMDDILEDIELSKDLDKGYDLTQLGELRRLYKEIKKSGLRTDNIDMQAVINLVKRKAPGMTNEQILEALQEEIRELKAKL